MLTSHDPHLVLSNSFVLTSCTLLHICHFLKRDYLFKMRRGIPTTYRKSTVAHTVGDLATFSPHSPFQQMLQVPPARTCNSLPKAHPWRWRVEVWGVDASGSQPLLGSRGRISGLVEKATLFPTHTPELPRRTEPP